MAYNLGFISDSDIFNHVQTIVKLYRTRINLKEFNKNLIDPIKLTFDAKVYGKSFEDIIESECIRQIDKANTNHIGYFHQNIFKYAGNGWYVPKKGFDVANDKLHIYVEMKNKHNTMNSSSAQSTYMKMQNKLLQDSQATCMLVEAIAKQSQDIVWAATLDGDSFKHPQIRRVSMDKFYAIVFKDKDAFIKLCKTLPMILDDVISANDNVGKIDNSVYSELKQISPQTLKSLYLLAFSTYDGINVL